VKTFVTHALEIWNSCPELRDAPTKAKANRAATRPNTAVAERGHNGRTLASTCIVIT
jgi:hypothetical protein